MRQTLQTASHYKRKERVNYCDKDSRHLFRFHKIRHLAVVISSTDIESCAGSLRAEAGEDAGFGLFVSCINGADLYTSAHQPQQPVVTVNSIVFEVQMQRLVPVDS